MHIIRYANLKNALIYHYKQINKREERNGDWKTYTHSPTLITCLPSLRGFELILQSQNNEQIKLLQKFLINKKKGSKRMKRVATASASGCADDACSNPSCPENPYYTLVASVCTALSFWKLPKYWNKLLASCRAPPARQNCHRHFKIPIGTLLDSSALQIVPVGTKLCRSAETSCRRQFDSKQRTDSAWHGVFGHI